MKRFNAGILLMAVMAASAAFAATPNPTPSSPGYTPVTLPIYGVISSASVIGVVKFVAPAGYKIVTASVNARAVSGTNPTLKTRINSGSFVNYSGTISAAGTPTNLVVGSTAKIADEATVAIDLVTGGTLPKWRDLTVFILLKRL